MTDAIEKLQGVMARLANQEREAAEAAMDEIMELRAEVLAYDYMIETAYVEKPVYNTLAKRLEDAERKVVAQKAARSAEQHGARMLVAENEALRKNSERYLWLRDQAENYDGHYTWPDVPFVREPSVDAAIDAAIAAEGKP